MEFTRYRLEWLEILKIQEEKLRVESFTADDAYALGGVMARIAREKYQKPVAMRVILGGQTTFSFLMEGTSMHNNWWMDKKLNTSRMTGLSSIRSLVEVAEGLRPMEPEFEKEGDFALCGGCFPLKNADGRLMGYVLASGLPHECDHQLLVDALSEYLRIPVPGILN